MAQIADLPVTLSRENLDEGQIVLFQLEDTTPATLSAWREAVLAHVNNGGAGCALMHDFSATDLQVTPDLRQQVTDLVTSMPAAPINCAFIIPPGEQGLMLQVLVNRLMVQEHSNPQRKFFFKREQGLDWLREKTNGNGCNGN